MSRLRHPARGRQSSQTIATGAPSLTKCDGKAQHSADGAASDPHKAELGAGKSQHSVDRAASDQNKVVLRAGNPLGTMKQCSLQQGDRSRCRVWRLARHLRCARSGTLGYTSIIGQGARRAAIVRGRRPRFVAAFSRAQLKKSIQLAGIVDAEPWLRYRRYADCLRRIDLRDGLRGCRIDNEIGDDHR